MQVDFIAIYWFIIKLLLIGTAILICISGLDDLFIDLVYWCRATWRKLFVWRKRDRLTADQLYDKPEQPIAIMVPAWQEAGVILQMLEHTANVFKYKNFHIFVGTYPNDPDTQADVDKVAAKDPRVHKVVTTNPGPTSKADCLNHVIEDIFKLEKELDLEFVAFVLHDSEDLVHPLELKLLNYMFPKNALVQLPVFPLERKWYHFTSGHYQDEFAEHHFKDVVVREFLTGNVPSAGVGTGFGRKAILTLAQEGEIFKLGSLTEDYDISFRLRQYEGMKQIFVRFPISIRQKRKNWLGREVEYDTTEWIAIKEYFPAQFRAAYRQKARWMIGIIFQGWERLRWAGSLSTKYILVRDRKAVVTTQLSVLAYFLILNVLIMEFTHWLFPDLPWYSPLIPAGSWIWWLIGFNGFLLINRAVHRAIFVTRLYNLKQGLLSIPRQIWGNVVNFSACIRALRQYTGQLATGQTIQWDKTTHEFPILPTGSVAPQESRQLLGEILLNSGSITAEQLEFAIDLQDQDNRRLGEILVGQGWLEPDELSAAVDRQERT